MRARLAPSAERTANSRRLTVPRAKVRFAMFTQAISSTKPTAADNRNSHGRASVVRSLCGGVSWESAEPPIVTRVCWCRDCQYLGAGSGTVNACFRSESFTVSGKTSDYRSVADSGNQMHRRFCPSCGTPLFSEAEARPHLIFVRVGTFDDPGLAAPAVTIWTSSAPAWAPMDHALPKVERQPPPAA